MRAVRLPALGAPALELVDVPMPEPGPGQARIAVTGAGLCGTDLHILHGDYSSRPPVTLGHEVAGRVDAVGEGVDPAWIGALVAPETAFGTCGLCRWCRTGRPMLCAERLSIGSGVDGGFAEAVIVPARLLHRLPDWLDDHAAALMEPLACCCNSLSDPAVIDAGDRVLVLGAGPVGLLAAQVARAAGASVVLGGTSADEERLAIARTMALDTLVVDTPGGVTTLEAWEAARDVDVVIECAGVGAAVATALRVVRPGGSHIQMGLLSGDVSIPFGLVVTKEIRVRAGFGSAPASWWRAVDLVAARAVDLVPLVSVVLPLRDWPVAFDRMASRTGLKSVLDPRMA
ncbi:MAG: alcohol dehydrogenase catalytic domain-containing protein [Chloroflexi bacterium]|nr:alcohol dehydrogenase catalytic domain-containing protein [Chloroflexota bacterium]